MYINVSLGPSRKASPGQG